MKKTLTLAHKLVGIACLGMVALGAAHADTIRVTVPSYSDNTKPYFEKMAKEFESQHPGDKVNVEMVSWDNLQQKLQTDISGNSAPDISVVGTRWLLDFVKDDLAQPLDDHMSAEFKERFVPAFLTPGKINNKIYGLPIAASARALYYNKDLLAKAGFPNGPQTWDDVIAISKKLKADKVYGFGLQGKEIETDVYYYYALWSYGGDVVDAKGKAAFNSDAAVKAATLYKSLIDNAYTQPGVTGYSREDVQGLFKQGRVAMMISAPFLAKQIDKEVPNLKYGVTHIPKGTQEHTYAVTDSIMVFKSSEHKDLAYKFLDFLFTKAPRVQFDSTEGMLPTTEAVAKDPKFADDPVLSQFVKLLPTAKFAPMVTGWEDAASNVINALQAVYLNKAQPKAALDQAAKLSDEKLGK